MINIHGIFICTCISCSIRAKKGHLLSRLSQQWKFYTCSCIFEIIFFEYIQVTSSTSNFQKNPTCRCFFFYNFANAKQTDDFYNFSSGYTLNACSMLAFPNVDYDKKYLLLLFANMIYLFTK